MGISNPHAGMTKSGINLSSRLPALTMGKGGQILFHRKENSLGFLLQKLFSEITFSIKIYAAGTILTNMHQP
jgi:hypothetical protein